MNASTIRDLMVVAGMAFMTFGCFWVHPAIGLIFAGVCLFAIATAWSAGNVSR